MGSITCIVSQVRTVNIADEHSTRMKHLESFFVLLTCSFAFSVHAQKLDVLVGSELEGDNAHIAIGADAHKFYTLRMEREHGNNAGFLEGWSRETLDPVFSTPLQVPVKNAEEFRVLEFVAENGRIEVFYSFFSKADQRVVLAMARFDDTGHSTGDAVELMSQDGKHERSAGKFVIDHDRVSQVTTLLSLKLDKAWASNDHYEPDITVAALGAKGDLLFTKPIKVDEKQSFELESMISDAQGNVFLRVNLEKRSKDGCKKKFIVAGPSAEEVTCSEDGPDGTTPLGFRGFLRDVSGMVHHVHTYGEYRYLRSQGVVIADFDPGSGRMTKEKTHAFKHCFPPDEKCKPKETAYMQYCTSLDAAYQQDGSLVLYGLQFRGVVAVGEDGFWAVKLDPASGFGKPWSCEAERKYSVDANWETPFLTEVIHLTSGDYLIANEIKENLGKPCERLTSWKSVGPHNGKTVPAYIRMDNDGSFLTHEAILDKDYGKEQFVKLLRSCSTPGEEYILLLTCDDRSRFVRMRNPR